MAWLSLHQDEFHQPLEITQGALKSVAGTAVYAAGTGENTEKRLTRSLTQAPRHG